MSKRVSSSTDRPIVSWGEALRRSRRRRRGQCRLLLLIGAATTLALLPLSMPRPATRLLWNASASAPVGLYTITPTTPLHRGDLVAVAVPRAMRSLAAKRHYIAAGVPLLKRIAAGPGDEVCALDVRLFVDGEPVAIRRRTDGRGRLLPWWEGCRILRTGDIFLLNPTVPDSFDGRYFGPSLASDILGIARPTWAG